MLEVIMQNNRSFMTVIYVYLRVLVTFTGFVIYQTSIGKKVTP